MEKLTGLEAQRIHVDKGYRGHSYPNKFRVWISSEVRRLLRRWLAELLRVFIAMLALSPQTRKTT
jgi:IS5 family transposase